ncbi:hypothetical protein ACE3MQ_01690 [Paenibacillus lentus]|uniref:hypothetical protein n=1 Tax=Paenibacillus lentus TaxID=1338368 RepID=UPI0036569F9F
MNTNIEDIRARAEQNIPLGRYGQPDELAKMVVFLASTANSSNGISLFYKVALIFKVSIFIFVGNLIILTMNS